MSYDLLLALTLFAFVSSITPGPNNLMLMASGANFGFRRTLPHLLGVGIGFTLMIVLVGVGLVQVFDLYPISHQILKLVSVIYLLWLAWKIANAATPEGDVQSEGTPITFIQAALFQWVNPKAWTMALTAISAYTPDQTLYYVSLVALVFGIVNLPSVSLWTVLGEQMARFLTSAARLRAFNWAMAGLLVLSLYPVVLG
ncbi:MAG: LysE family translocator [Planktotalea sp.]|jgi:threonine/homoserine/homoserine lactone efflux protein|uniref:LysE family translocator n=1 Tax=Planktotalea sp. TaxID=2029877 RepID=UPI00018398EC|nr:LysE family translocator [Planktotalea sp.]EDZ43315.1 transporter, LysE family [Rhodobacteraceae bacterium HTCC2083]MBT5820884.1 LysE family translocator [Paracoccaceae bacterium]MDG1075467.1 LysE family translocator [Planktotalea sp.]MDG1082736.1 LysE family translocator [Planktotalea sp.]HCW85542.1 LysE family translocator [Paracoccaceae bacterium]